MTEEGNCARDAQGLVLLPVKAKNRSEAEPEAARTGAQITFK